MDFDPIELVELAYQPSTSVQAWRAAMVDPVTRCIGPDAQARLAFSYSATGDHELDVVPNELGLDRRGAADDLAALGQALSAPPPYLKAVVSAILLQPGLNTSCEVAGRGPDTPLARRHGFKDSSAIIIHPGSGHTPIVFATLLKDVYRISSPQRVMWRRIAAHLAAGCRLSGRQPTTEASDVECVLSAGGQVLEARGAAMDRDVRKELRDAVKRIDRARSGRMRKDAMAALETWTGLFSGRWSMVDHYESDGRRFLLARRNDPTVTAFSAMPLRQRQILFYLSTGLSNKEIAYGLGVGEATVATHVRRALGTLGMSRLEWVRTSAALQLALGIPAAG